MWIDHNYNFTLTWYPNAAQTHYVYKSIRYFENLQEL